MALIFHSIELQMSVLLFVNFTGYFLASMINQPSVVGQILAGIIISLESKIKDLLKNYDGSNILSTAIFNPQALRNWIYRYGTVVTKIVHH